jgi:hypothetical protein
MFYSSVTYIHNLANHGCICHAVKKRLNSLNKCPKWSLCIIKYNTIKKCGGAKA